MIAAAACAGSLWIAIALNFYHYDDDQNPYVYTQTYRTFFGLYNEIQRYSNSRHDGGQTAISVLSPDYWPMPWYFRHDTQIGYFGRIPDKVPYVTRMIIISDTQQTQVLPLLGNGFVLQGKYPLRPGVVLDVYVRDFE